MSVRGSLKRCLFKENINVNLISFLESKYRVFLLNINLLELNKIFVAF